MKSNSRLLSASEMMAVSGGFFYWEAEDYSENKVPSKEEMEKIIKENTVNPHTYGRIPTNMDAFYQTTLRQTMSIGAGPVSIPIPGQTGTMKDRQDKWYKHCGGCHKY